MVDRNTLLAWLAAYPILAIDRPWLESVLAKMGRGEDSPYVTPGFANAFEAAIHPSTERAVARKAGSVAVVPVNGVILPKAGPLLGIYERLGLMTSVETLVANVRAAVADPDVKAVVLDVDSPGGSVFGVPEGFAAIKALRGDKPIVAHADFLMASAAYHLASAANEIVASPSALVGSVGAFSVHLDFSGMLEQEGVKPTFIASTPEKVDGNAFQPLSETGEAELRAIVDGAFRQMVADIAAGRAVDASAVRDDFGRGHVLTAKAGLAAGVIDKIRTLGETLAAFGVGASVQPSPAPRGRALGVARRQLELTDY